MSNDLPTLYVKTACPWCAEATGFLKEHGIGYREVNVSDDIGAFKEMIALSGQRKAPVLDWHGSVLADFGVDELVPFLREKNVKLEDS